MFAMKPKQQKTYGYPDGTKSTERPNDGQLSLKYGIDGTSTVYQWDDFKEQWFDVTGHYIGMAGDEFDRQLQASKVKKKGPSPIPTCDCGSEACGSNRHSSWCSKYPFQS